MTNYYNLLDEVIHDIDELINKKVVSSDSDFKAWRNKAERTLIKIYGEDSYEFKEFKKMRFSLGVFSLDTPDSEFIAACAEGLVTTKSIFMEYMKEYEAADNNSIKISESFEKVFIVHGHDGELKESVARLIEKMGIQAIILSEQTNQGRTIIEKFVDYSDVGAAIALFTKDDKCLSDKKTELFRARQNVVFEAGYFMGKLGRNKVILIAENGVEIPSDLNGVVYTDKNNWQFEVCKELKDMGYSIDLNKLI